MTPYQLQQIEYGNRTLGHTPLGTIWHGQRPKCAPAGTLIGPTGRTVTHDCYVLAPENFERAEQAIALCMAHGLLPPGRG